MMPAVLRYSGLPIAALLLSSCALTKGADEHVLLRIAPPLIHDGPDAWQGDVKLVPVRAQGLVSQMRYVYALGDGSALQQARTLSWDRPPPEYLHEALVAALRGKGLRVLKSGETGASAIRMAPTLVHFEERSGPGTLAAVTFDLEIQREGKPALVRRYCGAAPIRSAHASARAAAFSAALGSAVQAFRQESPEKTPSGASSGTDCAASLPSSSR